MTIATVFAVEFIFAVVRTVELLTKVWPDGGASGIGAEANICALTAVMAVLEFALLSPLE